MSFDSNNIFGNAKELLDSFTPFKFQPSKYYSETTQEIDDLILISDDETNKANKQITKRPRAKRNKRENSDNCDIDYVPEEPLNVRRTKSSRASKRLKQSKALNDDCCIIDITSPPAVSSRGGRARGRGVVRGNSNQRGRGRVRSTRRGRSRSNNSIITYNIGNTSDYPDELEDVPMFSTQNNDVIELDDCANIDNEELSVKVEWQSVDIYRFAIRKLQNIKQIYEFFSTKYNVGQDNLLFMYNSKILQPEDTPDSIGYREAKVIDGGIVYKNKINPEIFKEHNEKVESGIEIKFQYQNSKHPFISYVQNDETLLLAMTKCSEKLEIPLNKLKFEFDGDVISGKQTPNNLGLEGGECIDVKIIK